MSVSRSLMVRGGICVFGSSGPVGVLSSADGSLCRRGRSWKVMGFRRGTHLVKLK